MKTVTTIWDIVAQILDYNSKTCTCQKLNLKSANKIVLLEELLDLVAHLHADTPTRKCGSENKESLSFCVTKEPMHQVSKYKL